MLDYVNEQKQRKSGQSDSLHTGFITTTSGRRRKFRRTEKTDIGLCPIQGHEGKTWKMRWHTQRGPLATYASPSVPSLPYTCTRGGLGHTSCPITLDERCSEQYNQ